MGAAKSSKRPASGPGGTIPTYPVQNSHATTFEDLRTMLKNAKQVSMAYLTALSALVDKIDSSKKRSTNLVKQMQMRKLTDNVSSVIQFFAGAQSQLKTHTGRSAAEIQQGQQ